MCGLGGGRSGHESEGGLVETSVLHLNLTWLWPGTDAAISTRDQHQKERRSVKLV